MSEFKHRGNLTDENFMIHVLNNLPQEYDVILDRLENHLTLSSNDALMIEVIKGKLNHRYEKLRTKMKKKVKKKRT